MPILDTGAATHAGTITLTVQVRMDAAGNLDPVRGEVIAELRDGSQVVVREQRAGVHRLTASMQNSLGTILTNIRNTINTELAG